MFNWESDFFAQSKGGYYVECEIKISRGDFFADFKKEKHRLFQDFKVGKSHHIYRNTHWAKGDQLGRVKLPYLMLDRSLDAIDTTKPLVERNYRSWYSKLGYGKERPHMQKMYVVNDWGFDRLSIQFREQMAYASVNSIQIKPLSEILCPHQFYYAVPAGLIVLEELPSYAGLLSISTNGDVAMVKKAPYLHKRTMDLTRELLKKYYNLWQYKVPYETKLKIRKNYSEL